MTLAICAIVRDEAPYIAEWVAFHRLIGISRFFIYDDRSEDETLSILSRMNRGDVLTIRPNGDITACQEERPKLVFANLRDEGLDEAKTREILRSIKARECQPCGCCTWAFTHGARCLT
jgi:radical SAM protein with 4Fe4S-binding SPASM domain